jgi:hypothetical protein
MLRQIARLALQFGDARVRSDEQQRMMLAEWTEAFGVHAPEHLHRAVSEAMKVCKFWPSIAEITEQLREIRREAVRDLEILSGSGRFKPQDPPFARDGRTEAEEITHRTGQVLRWKAEARSTSGMSDPEPQTREWAPASREMTVSKTLLDSCAARRARGMSTCDATCQRSNCDLRESELKAHWRAEA